MRHLVLPWGLALLMLSVAAVAGAGAGGDVRAACGAPSQCEPGQSHWQPRGKLSWSIDYSADLAPTRQATARQAHVLPLHIVEALAAARGTSGTVGTDPVAELQCRHGRKLICYTNCGAWEAGHWNEAILAPERDQLLGKAMAGYPDERWLDIRRLDVMRRLVRDKFAQARRAGCDALVCDNTEAWITGTDGGGGDAIALYRLHGIAEVKALAARNVAANTGFDIGYDDQLRYNRMLAEEAHAQCLAIGLINDVFQIGELADAFDFALNEQCHHCGWCDLYRPFVEADKPVLHLEFDDNEGFCRPGSPPMADICAANRDPARRTFSSLKRAASSKLHLPDRPQVCR